MEAHQTQTQLLSDHTLHDLPGRLRLRFPEIHLCYLFNRTRRKQLNIDGGASKCCRLCSDNTIRNQRSPSENRVVFHMRRLFCSELGFREVDVYLLTYSSTKDLLLWSIPLRVQDKRLTYCFGSCQLLLNVSA